MSKLGRGYTHDNSASDFNSDQRVKNGEKVEKNKPKVHFKDAILEFPRLHKLSLSVIY